MAQLSDLIPLVRERAGGILDKFALDHLKRAYQKFCAESHVLAKEQQFNRGEPSELAVGEHHVFADVDFALDSQGRELVRGTDYTVSPHGSVTLTASTPSYRVFYHVIPALTLPDNVNANDMVIARWADHIADGAAASLMKMPNVAWTDFQIADYYTRVFTEGYREAYRVAVNALDEQRPRQSRVFY